MRVTEDIAPDPEVDPSEVTAVEDVDERDSVPKSSNPVSYFGTEFDVHGLVRRYNQGAIVVPNFDPSVPLPDPNATGFQRGRVWRRAQMDRFIESLLLGFPVPGIFLVEQPGKKYLVLDGQQRLTTIAMFYGGKFKLESVDDKLKGLTYSTLPDELQRALDDTFIQAIIIRAPASVADYESVYQIFERLNSGGTNLQPQEIRVALYGGTTVEAIRELNNDANWRAVYGNKNDRLKDQELILRVLALYVESSEYTSPLKTFLNDFLGNHRDGDDIPLDQLGELFRDAAKVVATYVGKRAFRLGTQVNAAILDSVFVGIMDRLANTGKKAVTGARWAVAYDKLLANSTYLDAVTKATANENSVTTRLLEARKVFARL